MYLKHDHLCLGQGHSDAAAAAAGEKQKFVGFKNKKDEDKPSRKRKVCLFRWFRAKLSKYLFPSQQTFLDPIKGSNFKQGQSRKTPK